MAAARIDTSTVTDAADAGVEVHREPGIEVAGA